MSIEKSIVVRYYNKNKKFEILIDPDTALNFRRGKQIDIRTALAYPAIYRDIRKAEVVNREELQQVFGTSDVFKVAEEILKRGEIQITTEQKRKMIEERKKQIAEIISKRAVDPRSNLPHPPARIMNAMEQVGVNVDPFLDAELQVDKVIKEIRSVLPLSTGKVLIEIRLPANFTNIYSQIKNICEIKKEEWLNDGTLVLNIEVLAGSQTELFSKISSLTKGNFQSRIISKTEL
ncbi:MAG: ribosome assembly factor SBDS [Candidatus Aenigmarchaeota archaeon]|nr:ribosome assembly factor SBDS [Candidatus Aenigmarchaeota archaeon]MDW8149217.1 ribosome assembly factor SBDS [Candidatus Aenigmarchaeota archaeon]